MSPTGQKPPGREAQYTQNSFRIALYYYQKKKIRTKTKQNTKKELCICFTGFFSPQNKQIKSSTIFKSYLDQLPFFPLFRVVVALNLLYRWVHFHLHSILGLFSSSFLILIKPFVLIFLIYRTWTCFLQFQTILKPRIRECPLFPTSLPCSPSYREPISTFAFLSCFFSTKRRYMYVFSYTKVTYYIYSFATLLFSHILFFI